MNIRVVKKNEYNAIRAFYHTLIDRMKDAEYKPGWEKEVYPSDAYLRESLENGDLWVYETDGGYAAAMILNRESNEGYKNMPAEKLYVKHGFRYIDTVQMFYEDTGWTNFKVYEYRFRQIDECV